MTQTISRRDFLKLGAASVGALAVGQMLPPRVAQAARDAGLYVARLGAFPIIPHTMTADFDKQLTDEFWIRGHLQLLARCDAIYLIADWRRSAGAKACRGATSPAKRRSAAWSNSP